MKNLRETLTKLSDAKYKEFAKKFLPPDENLLGVRIPHLRKIAKQAAADLESIPAPFYFEETMVSGMAIGYADIEPKRRAKLLEEFAHKITNWSVCDSVCATIKIKDGEQSAFLPLIKKYIKSKREYECRFAYVMLLDHFAEEEYADFAVENFAQFSNGSFYAITACAWCIATFHAKFPRRITEFLQSPSMRSIAAKKTAIRKILESRRTTEEYRKIIKSIRI